MNMREYYAGVQEKLDGYLAWWLVDSRVYLESSRPARNVTLFLLSMMRRLRSLQADHPACTVVIEQLMELLIEDYVDLAIPEDLYGSREYELPF